MSPLKKITNSTIWIKYRRMLGLFVFFYASIHMLSYVGLDYRFNFEPLIDDVLKKESKPIDVTFPLIEKFDYIPMSKKSDVSQYVSIMEGCSKYCTFCVVPYTRGEEVSRTLDEIIYEVSNLFLSRNHRLCVFS